MKNHSKIDISRLVDGTKVLVHVVDELPFGIVTGKVFWKGIVTVKKINGDCIDIHENFSIIPKISEIRRVYYKKSSSSCR